VGVEPNHNVYVKNAPPQKKKLSLVPICDWRGGEVVAIKETVSSVIIVKKIRQNCTLHHVVNKRVWTDIGAASTRSTNILVLRVLAAPIGEYTQAFYN
jgi:hypothetical protein